MVLIVAGGEDATRGASAAARLGVGEDVSVMLDSETDVALNTT